MQIEGPFSINVVDKSDSQSRELHLTFTDEFQKSSLEDRVAEFKNHLTQLQQNIQSTESDAEKQGMLTILQIAEQILPHVETDEIPLQETIVIEIGPSSPFDDLLRSATLK
jgi:hypothetical protein